uniref:Uncharacterized protein n=1 Tax=Anguilla anguilla TaxID=7936 RepID=A0A0E9S780_ANGAN
MKLWWIPNMIVVEFPNKFIPQLKSE